MWEVRGVREWWQRGRMVMGRGTEGDGGEGGRVTGGEGGVVKE